MTKAKQLSQTLPASRDSGEFAAVTVVPTERCCQVAREAMDHPLLFSAQPTLPLPGCTMRDLCACRFKVLPDRRQGHRGFIREGGQLDVRGNWGEKLRS